MKSSNKLSTHLNGCYSYFHINDEKVNQIDRITHEYIQNSEDKIYKQPSLSLRNIKVELWDIYQHHQRLSKELEHYNKQLHAIIAKGPRLEKPEFDKATELETITETLIEIVYRIEDSMAYITRMLLEHYSQNEIGSEFISVFLEYLGPFDWIGKAFKQGIKEKAKNFDSEVVIRTKELIETNEVKNAIGVLLQNAFSKEIEHTLISLKRQWLEYERKRSLNLARQDDLDITANTIVHALLSLL